MCTIYPSVFSKLELFKALERQDEEYDLVPTDRVCSSIHVRLIITIVS